MMKKFNQLSLLYRIMVFAGIFLLISSYRVNGQFVKGADVSWITQMEASGYVWYNSSGTQQDLFQILKNKGVNAIRLRVWVNPSNGWCNLNDVVNKAIRAKNAGMRIMIDFHYSDTWADPGHQTKPAAWSSLSFTDLMTTVYNYTYNAMNTLKANGITPDWVQVGNETNDGMLWNDGKASVNMKNFAWLVNCGYNAVKAVSSSTKVVVHISNGYDNTLFRWIFDGLQANGAQWDVIGMSLYPTPSNWQTLDNECLANMNDMRSRYGKDVMLCEVGMRADYPTTCESFLSDMISKIQSAGGLGLFYWEPEVYGGWQGYGLGAWQDNGQPTVALDAFSGGSSSGSSSGGSSYYQLQNRATGLYIDGMGRTSNGSNCGQWSASTSYNQQWTIESAGSYVKLKNRTTGLYLDGMGSTSNGSVAGQWSSSSSYNQQWLEVSAGSYMKFQNRATGLYLDGLGSTTNGADLAQWSSSSSYNQQFLIIAAKDAQSIIKPSENTDVSIYPNPVIGKRMNIALSGITGSSVISILNSSGEVLQVLKTENQNYLSVNMDYPAGIYLIHIINGDQSITKKVIVK